MNQRQRECPHDKTFTLTEFGSAYTSHYVENGEIEHNNDFGNYNGRVEFTCHECGWHYRGDLNGRLKRKCDPLVKRRWTEIANDHKWPEATPKLYVKPTE